MLLLDINTKKPQNNAKQCMQLNQVNEHFSYIFNDLHCLQPSSIPGLAASWAIIRKGSQGVLRVPLSLDHDLIYSLIHHTLTLGLFILTYRSTKNVAERGLTQADSQSLQG